MAFNVHKLKYNLNNNETKLCKVRLAVNPQYTKQQNNQRVKTIFI